MNKIKEIVKIILLIILLILIGTFVINLLPIFIVLFFVYLVINNFKKIKSNKQTINEEVNKKKTKDMNKIDLAIHMSEKTNKK